MQQGTTMSPAGIATRRRRARNMAIWIALFALAVYVGFIISFISR